MGEVVCNCKLEIEAMKADIALLKSHHAECAAWRDSFQADIKELIELLHQVRAAMSFFIVIGNGLKWIASVGAAMGAMWYIIRKALA
jgi:hypothetical protein